MLIIIGGFHCQKDRGQGCAQSNGHEPYRQREGCDQESCQVGLHDSSPYADLTTGNSRGCKPKEERRNHTGEAKHARPYFHGCFAGSEPVRAKDEGGATQDDAYQCQCQRYIEHSDENREGVRERRKQANYQED